MKVGRIYKYDQELIYIYDYENDYFQYYKVLVDGADDEVAYFKINKDDDGCYGVKSELYVDVRLGYLLNKDCSELEEVVVLSEEVISSIMRLAVKYLSRKYYKLKNNGKKKKYIPVSGKVLDENDLDGLIDASLDMWLTTGRFNDQFEKKLSDKLNVKYCLTTNSGSSANLLAITALMSSKLGERQVKKGDEVITVASGFPTTINPIIQNGLVPVFVDVKVGTYNIDVEQIEKNITGKTKVIFVAHTLGNPFDIAKVIEISKKYNLWVIEDNCDALGATFNGKFTGTHGHIGTCSFYPAHHITMGEGGALLTNELELYRIIMSYRDWGRDCWCPPGKDNTCSRRFTQQFGNLPFGYDHKYTYSHIGYNLKITDWQAAIGLSQLDKLDDFINKRIQNFEYLYNALKKFNEYFILPEAHKDAKPSWFGFLITLKDNVKFSKNDLVTYLEDNNIGTRQLFAGNILRQPMFVDNDISIRIKNSDILLSSMLGENEYSQLPETEKIMHSTFWIGVWPGLTMNDLDYIIEKIADFIKKNG